MDNFAPLIEPSVGNDQTVGAFFSSLTRNNSKIRADRAQSIAETTETYYKRTVEDLALTIKQLRRDRENLLDLSPTDAQSLKLASDFNAPDFVAKDIEIGVKLRNLEIQYEIALTRYNHLFTNNLTK